MGLGGRARELELAGPEILVDIDNLKEGAWQHEAIKESAAALLSLRTSGYILEGTEGMDRLASTEEIRQKMCAVLPLGRFQTKEEVAEMALFLATDSARYITGSVLAVDGGMSLVGFHAMMP